MGREKVSAVIITYNEEDSLPQVLAPLKFCDEILVVDSGSQDKTCEVAKSLGAKVISHEWEGFGKQKRFAVSLATYNWVLSLDADEIISLDLANEIQNELNAPKFWAYSVSIQTYFMDKNINLWGEKNGHVRFFNKTKANFGEEEVHEKVHLINKENKFGKLKGKVLHHSYKNLNEYFFKFNQYSSKAALYENKNRLVGAIEAYLRYKWRFFYLYILRGGFTFGQEGFYWCLFSSFYTLVKYAKCQENYRRVSS